MSDIDKRKEIYRISALLANDAPAAFLYFRNKDRASSSRLNGIESSGTFFFNELVTSWYLEPGKTEKGARNP